VGDVLKGLNSKSKEPEDLGLPVFPIWQAIKLGPCLHCSQDLTPSITQSSPHIYYLAKLERASYEMLIYVDPTKKGFYGGMRRRHRLHL
jgi:hypothetical protein